jgi:hypothetical protein
MSPMMKRLTLCACLVLAAACDEDDTPAPTPSTVDGGVSTGALQPWKEGNRWTYRVTDNGTTSLKVTTVGPAEPVGGTGPNAQKLANKVTTDNDGDKTISWQAVEGESLVRYREQSFSKKTGALTLEEHWDPFKLHVDSSAAHITPGQSWTVEYSETKLPAGGTATTKAERDVWKVDGVNQPITVPAGTFSAIVLIKSGGTSQKTYWYVPGIGKVKETGGQTEELVSYELKP